MDEKFAVFNFGVEMYLVKYICTKEYVTKAEIEDAIMSYYDSDAYHEDSSFEEIIVDIMSSFDGVKYKFLNCNVFNME